MCPEPPRKKRAEKKAQNLEQTDSVMENTLSFYNNSKLNFSCL